MKFKAYSVGQQGLVIANDHYVGAVYDCTNLTALATDGVIKAGTIIPANDSTAIGVLLNDVVLDENPNGTIVTHGFIVSSKLPVAATDEAITALASVGVNLVDDNGTTLKASE